jgi:hypothetical protein
MNDLVSNPPPAEQVADFSPRKKKDVAANDSSATTTSATFDSTSTNTTTSSSNNINSAKVVELEALVAELEKQLKIAAGLSGQAKIQMAKLEGEVKVHKSDAARANEQQRASHDKAIALDAVVKDLSARISAFESEVLKRRRRSHIT